MQAKGLVFTRQGSNAGTGQPKPSPGGGVETQPGSQKPVLPTEASFGTPVVRMDMDDSSDNDGTGDLQPDPDESTTYEEVKKLHDQAAKVLGHHNTVVVQLAKQMVAKQQAQHEAKPIQQRLYVQTKKLHGLQQKLSKQEQQVEQQRLEAAKALAKLQDSEDRLAEIRSRVDQETKQYQALAKGAAPCDLDGGFDPELVVWSALGIQHPVPDRLRGQLQKLHEMANQLKIDAAATPEAKASGANVASTTPKGEDVAMGQDDDDFDNSSVGSIGEPLPSAEQLAHDRGRSTLAGGDTPRSRSRS